MSIIIQTDVYTTYIYYTPLQFQKIVGNRTNYTHTVGIDNFYLLYEVAVQAYNSYDGSKRIFYGPRSDVAYVHSAEGSKYMCMNSYPHKYFM